MFWLTLILAKWHSQSTFSWTRYPEVRRYSKSGLGAGWGLAKVPGKKPWAVQTRKNGRVSLTAVPHLLTGQEDKGQALSVLSVSKCWIGACTVESPCINLATSCVPGTPASHGMEPGGTRGSPNPGDSTVPGASLCAGESKDCCGQRLKPRLTGGRRALIFPSSTETAAVSWEGNKDFLNQMHVDVSLATAAQAWRVCECMKRKPWLVNRKKMIFTEYSNLNGLKVRLQTL